MLGIGFLLEQLTYQPALVLLKRRFNPNTRTFFRLKSFQICLRRLVLLWTEWQLTHGSAEAGSHWARMGFCLHFSRSAFFVYSSFIGCEEGPDWALVQYQTYFFECKISLNFWWHPPHWEFSMPSKCLSICINLSIRKKWNLSFAVGQPWRPKACRLWSISQGAPGNDWCRLSQGFASLSKRWHWSVHRAALRAYDWRSNSSSGQVRKPSMILNYCRLCFFPVRACLFLLLQGQSEVGGICVCTCPWNHLPILVLICYFHRDVKTPHLRDCVHMYTTDWNIMRYK